MTKPEETQKEVYKFKTSLNSAKIESSKILNIKQL